MDWQGEGPQECGLEWAQEAEKRETVCPSLAGQLEWVPRGEPRALWHPGLWHLLVSEV